LEKKTAINLLTGFAVATKHYLREENGLIYDDLKSLISNIKSDLPGFEPLNEQKSSEINHNLPLEISLYLTSYTDIKVKEKKIDVPTANSMYANLNTMVDCLTQFERILSSPIPLAYSIHLSQTVWIYCLSLPFQLVDSIGYVTILIVFLASFILIGILQIGGEIENPFGYDENDLDLDGFCGYKNFLF
jgi:putative membrane protein